MLIRAIPFVFVILWASGFVGARFGLQYAEPATLLSIRMAFNVLLFLVLVAVLRRRLPTGKDFWHSCVVGGVDPRFLSGRYLFRYRLGYACGVEFVAGGHSADFNRGFVGGVCS